MFQRALRTVSTLLIVLFLGAFGLYLDLIYFADTPAAINSRPILITISPGQSFRSVIHELNRTGIIKSKFRFYLLSRIQRQDRRVQAGEYALSASMTPEEILSLLAQGKTQLYRITIPEGYTLRQIADLIEKAGLGTAAAFLEKAMDPALAKKLGIPAKTLEGYLFPETYFFQKGLTPELMIAAMVKRFESIFIPAWQERAKQLNLSRHQVVTLASIIEKETGAPIERPIISSVFHNRLKKGMRLESDPTVIYGLDDFDGNLTRSHLNTRTPYNTYKISGLPPGPIANPGTKSLEAALYPADTEYLYFVSKKDTTHQFSVDIKGHNRAVRRYQLNR